MMWYDGGWGWGAWLGGSLMMVVFWGLVAWVVVTLVRHSNATNREPTSDAGPGDAMAVLERRFAAGEIDEDEFRRRRDVLRRAVSPIDSRDRW